MPRDYAKNRYRKQSRTRAPSRKNKRSTKKREPINPFLLSAIWLAIGLLIGSFGSTLVFLQHPQSKTQVVKKPSTPKKILAENKTTTQENVPKFDFYTILPEKNVEVEKKEEKPIAKVENIQYLLQVASVKKSKDADRLKAQLSLLGFNVYITDPKSTDSKWYRVNVGPFKTLADAQKHQKRLRENKLNSLLIKKTQSA